MTYSKRSVTIIDLDLGNLQSVLNAFKRIGAKITVARTAEEAVAPDAIVLPGVGAFQRAIDRLHREGFVPLLRKHVSELERPLLGICLGMQLLADRSHEHGLHEGLAFVPGNVVRLRASPPRDRVPNIGWVPVDVTRESVLFPSSADQSIFYHVHSYHLECAEPSDVVATFAFGGESIVTAIERENVFGVQFHPEKSQDVGLDLLDRWLGHAVITL